MKLHFFKAVSLLASIPAAFAQEGALDNESLGYIRQYLMLGGLLTVAAGGACLLLPLICRFRLGGYQIVPDGEDLAEELRTQQNVLRNQIVGQP